MNLIIKRKSDLFLRIQEQYKDQAIFWGQKLFVKSEKIVDQVKSDLQTILQQIVDEMEAKKKKYRKKAKEEDLCVMCFCPDQLEQLCCGHYFHNECLAQYIQITCEDKLLDGIKCPSGEDCKLISYETIKGALKEEFELLVQKAMVKYVSSKNKNDIKGCWTPDCPSWYLFQGQENQECMGCLTTWCLKKPQKLFSVPPNLKEHVMHYDGECDVQMQNKISELEFEKMILPMGKIISSEELNRKKNAGELVFRRCPNTNCGAPVEHRDACKHMTCKCGAHFCFTCGQKCDSSTIYEHMRQMHGGMY